MEVYIVDGVATPALWLNNASRDTQLKLSEIHLEAHNRRNGWRVCLVLASIVAAFVMSPHWLVGIAAVGLLVGRTNVLEYIALWFLLNAVIYGLEQNKQDEYGVIMAMLADVAAFDAKTCPKE